MDQQVVFSIIIPHKNTPQLLQRCLDSIPVRRDIQVVVVDDNSNENAVDFDNFPGLNIENVEIYFTKESKGAGYARNVGLMHVKGQWVLFADADDFFTEKAFDILFDEANSIHDIVYFKIISCFSDTKEPSERAVPYNLLVNRFLTKQKDAENWLRYRYYPPWAKMIKASLVKNNNILFEEIMAGNDAMFSLLVGYHAASISAVENVIYCITVNRGSITNTVSFDKLKTTYLGALRYNDFLKAHHLKKYQTSTIIYYIVSSMKYGISAFFDFIKLAIHYKANPFIGMNRWLSKFVYLYKRKKRNKKYIITK